MYDGDSNGPRERPGQPLSMYADGPEPPNGFHAVPVASMRDRDIEMDSTNMSPHHLAARFSVDSQAETRNLGSGMTSRAQ